MEERIKEQLFGTIPVEVRIEEQYELSEQYTPEALMREYRDSIIEELKHISVLAASMFAQADISFEEGNIIQLYQREEKKRSSICWRKYTDTDSG